MKKLCTQPGCKTIVDNGEYRCALHPAPKPVFVRKEKYGHHYHDGKNIYWTNRWKKITAIVKAEQPVCARCDELGLATPVVIVDHIKELEDGGDPFDRSNLEGLCFSHHNNKTAREKKARSKVGKSLSDY